MNIPKELLGKDSVNAGDEVQIEERIKVKYEGRTILLEEKAPSILTFIISFPIGVAASLVANAIWERIKGKKIKKLSMDRTEVEYEIGKILHKALQIEAASEAVEKLWQITVKTRALTPSTNDLDTAIAAYVSPSWYQKRGATYFVQPAKSLTAPDLIELNQIGKSVNQGFIIAMASILEGFGFIPYRGNVDQTKKCWEYAQLTKWLRNYFTHGELKRDPTPEDLKKAQKTHDLLVKMFPKVKIAEHDFPTSIDTILEPLKENVITYICDFSNLTNP